MASCCRKGCTKEASEREAVNEAGEVVAAAMSCDTCFEEDMVEFRGLQAEFQALIDAGVAP